MVIGLGIILALIGAFAGLGMTALFVGYDRNIVACVGGPIAFVIAITIIILFMRNYLKPTIYTSLEEKKLLEHKSRVRKIVRRSVMGLVCVLSICGWIRFGDGYTKEKAEEEAHQAYMDMIRSKPHYSSKKEKSSSGSGNSSGSHGGSTYYGGSYSGSSRFDVDDYDNAEDFADDNGDYFDNYGDAEDYWEEHH